MTEGIQVDTESTAMKPDMMKESATTGAKTATKPMTSTDPGGTVSNPDKQLGTLHAKINRVLLKKGINPPNFKYIGLMWMALLSSSFTMTFLFPFLPEMVKWLGYSEEEKGYYVGLIASSVFAGRAFGSFFWGWLSDIKGRKMVLLTTIAGNGIFCFLFGFTTNLPLAMVLRFFSGLLNGTVGTAKTVLYEISDNTNQAVGMSAITLAWGFGLILGPTIGGYLSDPAKKYPDHFSADSFFGRFPFMLPSLIVLLTCIIGFVIIALWFDETLQIEKEITMEVSEPNDESGDELKHLSPGSRSASRQFLSKSRESLTLRPGSAAMSIEDLHSAMETGPHIIALISSDRLNPARTDAIHHESNSDPSQNNLRNASHVGEDSELSTLLTEVKVEVGKNVSNNSVGIHSQIDSEDSVRKRMTDVNIMNAVNEEVKLHGSNGVTVVEKLYDSPVVMVNENQMSLLKETSNSVSSEKRSCFSSMCRSIRNSKLGTQLAIGDVRNSIMLYTVFSFAVIGSDDIFTIFLSTEPRLNGVGFSSSDIGLSLGIVSAPLLVFQLIAFPLAVNKYGIKKTFIAGAFLLMIAVQMMAMISPFHDNKTVLWTLLILILLPQRLAANICFAGSSLMVNNSCKPQNAGTVNGIAMTLTAIARTLAPTMGGGLFAWSVSYGADNLGPPFDHNLAFFVFGFVFFINIIHCLLLPERLNKQKRKP